MTPPATSSRFTATVHEGRGEITFDDGRMNLLSAAALRELAEVVSRLRAHDLDGLVFRSGRPGLFAAGADMAEMREFTPAEAASFARAGQELFERIEQLPCLTIALIDGDCFGGALDLAMAFDVRLASARSRFAHPGARIGIATGFGGTTRWRKLMQRPAAHALFVENRVLESPEAEDSGIVRVCSDFEGEIAALMGGDRRAVRLAKELAAHAHALSRSQLRLLARKLGALYFR